MDVFDKHQDKRLDELPDSLQKQLYEAILKRAWEHEQLDPHAKEFPESILADIETMHLKERSSISSRQQSKPTLQLVHSVASDAFLPEAEVRSWWMNLFWPRLIAGISVPIMLCLVWLLGGFSQIWNQAKKPTRKGSARIATKKPNALFIRQSHKSNSFTAWFPDCPSRLEQAARSQNSSRKGKRLSQRRERPFASGSFTLSSECLSGLFSALASQRAKQQRRAAEMLFLAGSATTSVLLKALKSPKPQIRWNAAQILKKQAKFTKTVHPK